MYGMLGICLALAALLIINATGALSAGLVWRALRTFADRRSGVERARLLLFLRVAPVCAGLLFVLFLFAPAWLIYEPEPTGEGISLTLAVLATASAVGLAFAVWRGLTRWYMTRSLLKEWFRHSQALRIEGVELAAYRLDHPFPVIAVVGLVRPRLFVAESVLATLTREELCAAVAHETSHVKAYDNLKRMIIQFCRDSLPISPFGKLIERQWNVAAEDAADEDAARRDSTQALELASALVKIARLVSPQTSPTMPLGAFLIGDDVGGLAGRIRRLVEWSETGAPAAPRSAVSAPTVALLLLLAVAYALTGSQLLAALHGGIERIIAALA